MTFFMTTTWRSKYAQQVLVVFTIAVFTIYLSTFAVFAITAFTIITPLAIAAFTSVHLPLQFTFNLPLHL